MIRNIGPEDTNRFNRNIVTDLLLYYRIHRLGNDVSSHGPSEKSQDSEPTVNRLEGYRNYSSLVFYSSVSWVIPVDADSERTTAAVESTMSLSNTSETVQVIVLSIDTTDGYHAEERLEVAAITVEMCRRYGDSTEEIILDETIRTVEELAVERIIMCDRRRTPTGKAVFGSVFRSVILSSNIQVTILISPTA